MSRRFALKRYADHDRLRRVRFALLLSLLTRFEGFFRRRELNLSESPETFDYGRLAAILGAPGTDTPAELVDALFLLEDSCVPEQADRLAETALSLGLALPEDFTPEDAAMAIYLENPEELKRLQCAVACRMPRKYTFFAPRTPMDAPIMTLGEAATIRIKTELDRWLDGRGKGRGNVSIQTMMEGSTCQIAIRHGGFFRRENKIDAGDVSTFAYRPPEYDLLRFDLVDGAIGLNLANKSKGQEKAFLDILGRNCLGVDNAYEPAARYSFAPLLLDGRDALRCDDVPGLARVRVIEWSWRRMGVHCVHTMNRGLDLFAEIDAGHVVSLTRDTQFTLVKFALQFAGQPQPRIVTLRGVNVAEYTRDEDAPVVEEWLLKRGFRLPPRGLSREVRSDVA